MLRTKLKGTQRQPDAPMLVFGWGSDFICNVECQAYEDREMAERMLLYEVLLWWEYKERYPVRSCLLALIEEAQIAQSPLIWTAPGKPKEQVRFSYGNIEMWKRQPEDLLHLKHLELLPFLPLTQGGAERAIVEEMLGRLAGEQHREIAAIAYLFASRVFQKLKREDDLKWLEKRFQNMNDILRESPLYQQILAEGEAKGEAKGIAQGVAAMRQVILEIVQQRFASLTDLTATLVTTINDLAQLQRLLTKLILAQNAEQARQDLLDFAQ
jgi:predicted transposase YdaD